MYRDATERITREQLHGAPKKKRHGTRSPLKDLARLSSDVRVWQVDGVFFARFPIRTESELNQREHHIATYKRKKVQQDQLYFFWLQHARPHFKLQPPYHVKFTRLGPRALDSDNLASSQKATRDQLSKILKIDDGRTDLITFEYAQEPHGKREYAVRIEIRGSVQR